jgi:ribosomal protein S18 acetylase RimI-like enzyme
VIRPATPADAPSVLALWSRARSQAATTPDTEEALRVLIERDPGALLVAEVDGELAGTVIAAFDGWRGNLYRLTVVPELRRRGIGRRLVAAGEQRLRELGARRVTALVGRPDERAAAFWEATGYPYDPHVARHVRNLTADGAG